jgi:hypothetical protein
MELTFDLGLLCTIVNESLNVLDTKLARFISLGSSFNPARIMEDKAWVVWVCYLILNHAHPTLKFGIEMVRMSRR